MLCMCHETHTQWVFNYRTVDKFEIVGVKPKLCKHPTSYANCSDASAVSLMCASGRKGFSPAALRPLKVSIDCYFLIDIEALPPLQIHDEVLAEVTPSCFRADECSLL